MSACRLAPSFQALKWTSQALLLTAFLSTTAVVAFGQETPPAGEVGTEEPTNNPLGEVRQVTPVNDNDFSIGGADVLVSEATQAIAVQEYDTAISKLTEARELYNELSTFYQELASMFVGIDTRQNRSNRDKALETAQKRDQATYQLALLYRSQNQPEEAIPLLLAILRSQQPTRDLGQQAYQQLFELGFVEAPYEN